MSYVGAEGELFVEAMRLAPAIAAARLRNAPQDTQELYQGFLDDAKERGVASEQAWSILAAAGMVWVTQLLERQAALEGTCVHATITQAVAAAQDWVARSGA